MATQKQIQNMGQAIYERQKRINELEVLLRDAWAVIHAYGEDEGYIPHRVAEEYTRVEREAYGYGWPGDYHPEVIEEERE